MRKFPLLATVGVVVVAGAVFSWYSSSPQRDNHVAASLEMTEPSPANVANKDIPDRTNSKSEHKAAVRSIGKFTPVPSGSAAEVVGRLEYLAKSGDSQAAYELYLKLMDCANQIRVRNYSDATCGAPEITKAVENRGEWLERAAAAGLLEAQLMFATDGSAITGEGLSMMRNPEKVVSYKAKAVGYLREAASLGNADAMLRLGDAYKNGILVQADPVQALAYYRLAEMALPGQIPRELSESYAVAVPSERRAAAENLARSMYSACCSN